MSGIFDLMKLNQHENALTIVERIDLLNNHFIFVNYYLKIIFYKNNLNPDTDIKICTIQPNILMAVGLKYEG